ncbi:MAG: glycosyltransferase family 4 protein [Candidatus Omnitrophota bacterium]
MKALHVTTHLNIGGVSKYVVSLAQALEKKGVECIVASGGGTMMKELERSGIRHIAVDLKTKFEFGPKVLRAIPAIAGIIREEDIDIVHAHTRVSQVASFFAARRAKIPYVSTCHGFFKKRIGRRLFDFWGKGVIAISPSVRDSLVKDFGVAPERVELIYSGIDIDRSSNVYSGAEIEGLKRVLGIKEGLPLIGTIGRVSPVKGHEFFVKAIAELRSRGRVVQGVIIGDGPDEDNIKTLARVLGVNDLLYLISARSDTAKYIAIMDIFVFPSVKEGLGLALLEAMAHAKPCISSDVGGISDIVRDGENGILFPAGDVKKLSDSIGMLLDDHAMGVRIGRAAGETVRGRFSIETMADKVRKFYGEMGGLNAVP